MLQARLQLLSSHASSTVTEAVVVAFVNSNYVPVAIASCSLCWELGSHL